MDRLDPHCHAFLTAMAELARVDAKRIEAAIMSGTRMRWRLFTMPFVGRRESARKPI